MEEKVLIKGVFEEFSSQKKDRKQLANVGAVLLVIGIIGAIVLGLISEGLMVLGFCLVIVGVILIACYVAQKSLENEKRKLYAQLKLQRLQITETRVIGTYVRVEYQTLPNGALTKKLKVEFAKEITLPIKQISSVGDGLFEYINGMNSLNIATSSGEISFVGLANIYEVKKILSELISSKDMSRDRITLMQGEINNKNNLDDLVKLKNLLDSGIITQEEFDEKKKQLLNNVK